ncbi:TPA: coproporphyrinogen III oxidase [Klebsiella pneumoniae]|nr:coproporphyrinogen III oxidase [Klebsiella pneumoniae]
MSAKPGRVPTGPDRPAWLFCGLSSDIAIEQNILNRYVDIIAKECDLAGHPRHLPERGLRASRTW